MEVAGRYAICTHGMLPKCFPTARASSRDPKQKCMHAPARTDAGVQLVLRLDLWSKPESWSQVHTGRAVCRDAPTRSTPWDLPFACFCTVTCYIFSITAAMSWAAPFVFKTDATYNVGLQCLNLGFEDTIGVNVWQSFVDRCCCFLAC